jgi:hypothetical protein
VSLVSESRIARASTPTKKSEGVVPSRRHVENRRAEWVRTLALTATVHPSLLSALEHQDEFLRVLRDRRDDSIDPKIDLTAPEYLLAFLPSHPSRPLPPPA